MVQKNKNKPKRYVAIVKIGNMPDGSARCVKYRFNNLLKFTTFLDTKWTTWKWFNVYANTGENKRKQVGNFTNRQRPQKATI